MMCVWKSPKMRETSDKTCLSSPFTYMLLGKTITNHGLQIHVVKTTMVVPSILSLNEGGREIRP